MKDTDGKDSTRSPSEQDKYERSPFAKFEDLTRRLVAVPKHEVEELRNRERK